MVIASVNPATGELWQSFAALSAAEINLAIKVAEQAFQEYRSTKMAERAEWLAQAAALLLKQKQTYAKLITQEMGKTLVSAIAEVEKCAAVCTYYAEHGADFLADQGVSTDASQSYICYQPLGIILAVMPWNFPFWQVFRFAAPALMAGNVTLLKHASNVPGCGLAIAEIFRQAGFAPGVFQTLLIEGSQVAAVVADPRIKAATLTGSEAAGQSLAIACGRELKKAVLELGGSDPFIVTETADLELAVSTAVKARLLSNGQSCIAAKRFILLEAIAVQVEQMLVEKFRGLKVGDPMAADTDLGPLATPQMVQELKHQVEAAIAAGARLVLGGEVRGNYFPPMILADIPASSAIYAQELFGPVASLYRVADFGTAIALANDSPFGLGASVWTENVVEIRQAISQIEAGAVFINGMVKSDPRLPFGGTKRSGYGRELGEIGIKEFVNLKSVWIK
ncbi:MAG: NAD-dependent succinate-semialdehyde dehydrogenase [Pseudanabaenaceae cyanobacterium bins.68]|nr:NAD-dependent succinate-semialdehyde dehydrogenase [Pseudanabaenaceae cyanobacterium bins.68]